MTDNDATGVTAAEAAPKNIKVFVQSVKMTKDEFSKIFTADKNFRKGYSVPLRALIKRQIGLKTRVRHSALLLKGKGGNLNLVCTYKKDDDKECAVKYRCAFKFNDYEAWFTEMAVGNSKSVRNAIGDTEMEFKLFGKTAAKCEHTSK